MAKTHEVLTAPAPGTVISPVHEYTDEQKGKMKALLEVRAMSDGSVTTLAHARRQYAHTLVLPESDPYREWEVRWLNKPDTIPRYMRAAKWDLEDGKKRIEGTLHWRREFKPELIPPEEVSTPDRPSPYTHTDCNYRSG